MQPPERIHNDVAEGRLSLHWAKAAIALDHAALREACRCAECHFKRHHGLPIDAPPDARITAIAPAGYGVQLVFSDGHARGLFPWAYLALLAERQKLPKDSPDEKKRTDGSHHAPIGCQCGTHHCTDHRQTAMRQYRALGALRLPRALASSDHRRSGRMFGDITRFLLDTIFTLFGAALLLRAWTQAVRLSPRNPLSQAIFQVTGWLVHPLRRVIPATGYIDWSCLVAAYAAALVYLLLLLASVGVSPMAFLPMGFVAALFTVIKWAFNVLVWVTIVSAVLSWVAPHSPMGAVLGTLVDPLLRPIRRVVPPLGGLDLSPLILLVVAQVAVIALSHLSLSPLFM